MYRFLFIVSLMSSSLLHAESEDTVCSRHRVYCAIVELQPQAEPYAMELSNLIYKYSKKYNTDPFITVAIGMQESGLRMIHRTAKGIYVGQKCLSDECETVTLEKEVYTDIGIFQFHYGSLSNYDIDFTKVYLHDMPYTVEKHVQILKDKMNMCSSVEDTGWACYHSATPKHKKNYEKLVMRYYNKIKKYK